MDNQFIMVRKFSFVTSIFIDKQIALIHAEISKIENNGGVVTDVITKEVGKQYFSTIKYEIKKEI